MLADSPRPDEFDDTWPEPVQAEWVTLALALTKADGTPVRAEFLRPREWVDRLGIRVGEPLPIAVTELDIAGDALVTGISPCPPIAVGTGRVVAGRFVTRSAGNVVLVSLANGTEIRATDIHPVWSVDREEWVPAGELEPGEQVDTLAGPVAVVSVERLESPLDVYNIEVHGEHVFRVTGDGVLVHNGDAEENCAKIIDEARNAIDPNRADKWSRGAKSIQDQMTLDAAKKGAGIRIIDSLGDSAFKGLEKWEYRVKSADGLDSVVHYVRDPKTGQLTDFKFKKHSTDTPGIWGTTPDPKVPPL